MTVLRPGSSVEGRRPGLLNLGDLMRLVNKGPTAVDGGALRAYPKDARDRIARAVRRLEQRGHARYGFLDAGNAVDPQIAGMAEKLRAVSDDLIVLGIGGSALGTI